MREGSPVLCEGVGIDERRAASVGVPQVHDHLSRNESLGDLLVGVVPRGFDRVSHEDHPALCGQGREPVSVGVDLALAGDRIGRVQ